MHTVLQGLHNGAGERENPDENQVNNSEMAIQLE